MLRRFVLSLRDLDPACKEYYLKADSELAAISIAAAVLLIPPIAYLDYYYYGQSADFYAAFSGDVLFALFSLGIVWAVLRSGQVRTYETLVFAWGLVTSVFGLAATAFEPARVIENLLFCLLFFLANFVTLRNRLLFRMIPAAIICAAILTALLTNSAWLTFANKYMFALTLLMLTVVGLTVLASNNRFRLATFALQKSEREAHLLYEALARTDPLTGIPNRRSFYERAAQEWNRYARHSEAFCIAVLDLDRFKLVNDSYGHAVGDEVLKQFSTLMTTHMRAIDFFARVGGEEFAVLFAETHARDAVKAVTRLRTSLQTHKIRASEVEVALTFSAGVAEVRRDDKSLDDTINRGDQALYRAKELGRDKIELG
jgi:diguanylate cyclase (GGDEF)-like protein